MVRNIAVADIKRKQALVSNLCKAIKNETVPILVSVWLLLTDPVIDWKFKVRERACLCTRADVSGTILSIYS